MTNKVVSSFTLTPADEDYYVNEIVVNNAQANFDFEADGDGVTNIKLWTSTDATWESTDSLVAQISDGTATFNSTTKATLQLDDSNSGDNVTSLLIVKSAAQQFLLRMILVPVRMYWLTLVIVIQVQHKYPHKFHQLMVLGLIQLINMDLFHPSQHLQQTIHLQVHWLAWSLNQLKIFFLA